MVLCGFMGAGKTTTGRLLAHRLNWRFQDADQVIEAEEGISIAEMFARFGEPYFREKEHQTISRLLSQENTVIALGGGAVENAQTRALLLAHPGSLFVHLAVSIETVLSRCSGTEDVRPIFRDRERLEARYQSRIPLYQQAPITISTDDLTPAQVSDELMRLVKKPLPSPHVRRQD